MIHARALTYWYSPQDSPALQHIDLEIPKGQYVALIGPNGCGKTTLIRHFNALLKPSKGAVCVDGLDTADPSSPPIIRQRVGMIFQNPDHQLVGSTVEEDISFGPGNLQLPTSEIRERVSEALHRVGMTHSAHKPPHSLSGGEKQLVAIAGVLAMKPTYIAVDEPTSYLDPSGRRRVLEVLKELHKRGMTLIHIAHDMDEILDAERIIVMKEGRIILDDSPSIVFSKRDWLNNNGLDVPQVVELTYRLRKAGAPLRPGILHLEDACAEITALMRAKPAQKD
jgi:biotin transport system ATP-binding protein/energy-coupling factor transport system ATP-binding protein